MRDLVDLKGVEPLTSDCKTDVFPLAPKAHVSPRAGLTLVSRRSLPMPAGFGFKMELPTGFEPACDPVSFLLIRNQAAYGSESLQVLIVRSIFKLNARKSESTCQSSRSQYFIGR